MIEYVVFVILILVMNFIISLFVLSLKPWEISMSQPTTWKVLIVEKMNQLFNSGKQTSKNLAIFTKHIMQEFK